MILFSIDTNVLVYAYDRSETAKQSQALRVLDQLAITGRGVITTQVMAEFFAAVTRKIVEPIPIDKAIESLHNYHLSWRVIDMTSLVVLEAARGVNQHQFNF